MSRPGLGSPLVISATLVALIALASPPVLAQSEETETMAVLEQLIATVDDEPILLGEIVADLQYFVMQSGKLPAPEEQLRLLEEAREGRIREKMLIAKARRDEIQVGEEEFELAMDRHLARIKEQAGGETRFQAQLEREGISERELRRDLEQPLRDQLLAQRIVERLSYGLQVDDEELSSYYDRHRDDPDRVPLRPRAAVLSHLVVTPKASPEREEALQNKLAEVRRRLAAGEDFAEVARTLSEGPAAVRGGDLGWWKLTDIALPDLAYGVSELAAGETRDDIRSEQGWHIAKMEEREGDRVHFRQIFLPLPLDENDRQAARDRAREAWQRLQAGEDWDATVLAYSDDLPTRDQGGRLPAIPEEQLDDRYRSVVEVLEPGEHSGVFLGKHGYQILRLEGRDPARPFALEEITDQLRADILGRKRNQAIEEYVTGLESELVVTRREIPPLDRIAALGGP